MKKIAIRCPRCKAKATKQGSRTHAQGRVTQRYVCRRGHWFERPLPLEEAAVT